MFQVRKAQDRGHLNHGWLDTWHTFSFGDYYDPEHMGFRALRVMNDDRVAPGQGFGMHGHRDMEILTYVLEGRLAHKDSLGHGEELRPGEFQRMSAGTGIRHSEFNPSADETVHLYQIWLLPERQGLAPGYEQKAFPPAEKQGRWQQVASPDGAEGSLTINQNACVYLSAVSADESVTRTLVPERYGWLQVLLGSVIVAGHRLTAGDGLAIGGETEFTVTGQTAAEVMLFDLP